MKFKLVAGPPMTVGNYCRDHPSNMNCAEVNVARDR
jgi:hypothetical protein